MTLLGINLLGFGFELTTKGVRAIALNGELHFQWSHQKYGWYFRWVTFRGKGIWGKQGWLIYSRVKGVRPPVYENMRHSEPCGYHYV